MNALMTVEFKNKCSWLSTMVLLFFCCGLFSATAQNDTLKTTNKVRYDQRSTLEPVRFDSKKINSYKEDPDFDYHRKMHVKNWWDEFKAWLAYIVNSILESLFGSITAGGWLGVVLKVLKYLFIAGLLFLIAWLFAKLNPGKAMLKPKAPPEVLLSEDERIIRNNNISELIEQARHRQNYRLAVRYYYLLVLKTLKEEGLIYYAGEKTNQDYQTELESDQVRQPFIQLTRLYDYIWYGDFSVDQRQYKLAERQFNRLLEGVKNRNDE